MVTDNVLNVDLLTYEEKIKNNSVVELNILGFQQQLHNILRP